MRPASQSLKVSNWLRDYLLTQDTGGEVLDLQEMKLPFFDDSQAMRDLFAPLSKLISAHDAYVFVSPEWNGMMSTGLINLLHYAQNRELAYKPVMLVGVSSGRGGSHPLDQMKLLGQKNRHYIISPENLIVSGVQDTFNDLLFEESSVDLALKQRASYALKILVKLAESLKPIRESDLLDFERFGNGV